MARPQHYFDWQRIVDEQNDDEAPENTRGRLRWVFAGFCLAALIILARAAQLEITDGENFRRRADEPIERTVAIPPVRGRILARDGTVLAEDRMARAVAVQFRYLENPPNAAWLNRLVRGETVALRTKRPRSGGRHGNPGARRTGRKQPPAGRAVWNL